MSQKLLVYDGACAPKRLGVNEDGKRRLQGIQPMMVYDLYNGSLFDSLYALPYFIVVHKYYVIGRSVEETPSCDITYKLISIED